MVNTLVYNPLVYKGFQWLLYNRTLADVYELKETLVIRKNLKIEI